MNNPRFLVSIVALAVSASACWAPLEDENPHPWGRGTKGTAGPRPTRPAGGCTTDESCGSGLVCDRTLGACARPLAGCGSAMFEPKRAAGEIVLVLDRSNSMRERTRTGSKWGDMTEALEGVLARRSDIAWGLSVFPASDHQACLVSRTVPAPMTGAAAAIMNSIRSKRPTGSGTPTRVALREAGRHLLASERPGRKYILLATDGEPNCRADHRDPNALDVEATRGTIRSLAAQGVTTFVVGVAARPSAHAALSAMAQDGGHARQGMTAYYPAADARDLEAALDQVARQVALCTFDLEPPPPAGTGLELFVGGRVFPRNVSHTGDGWDVTNAGRSIALYGAACEAVQAGARIQARYHCPLGTTCDPGGMTCVASPMAGGAPGPVADAGVPDAAPSADASAGTDTASPSPTECPSGCGVDRRCRFNAHCGPGGLCEGGLCRRACTAAQDCGTGDACVNGHCRPASVRACVFNADCGGDAVCLDGVCHARCARSADCPNPHDACEKGICRPNRQRVASCRASTECSPGAACVDGTCRTPCCRPEECAAGSVCWTGYCFLPQETAPACFLDGDCGENRTCVDATCAP